ncbi:HYR domain-containing protein [Aquimarina algiphila]|uniref:HYR domain-containing protein n=1 Tax=Aquimarina algiphila TaxID=2047982 RepID=A0A554VL96_9FLAO|nr:HYR domain-containing protein [Aquimarina algiphila]TSE08870.1 HYR domain-containing protein [Aquimarina algiphila]
MGNTSKNVFTTKLKLNLVGLILIFNASISFGQGCPEVPISGIDETNSFVVEGENEQDDLGYSVKDAGDVNGDGISDIIIGAPFVDSGSIEDVGEAYVIFGGSGVSSTSFDITSLNGTNGFIIRGTNQNDRLGTSVSTAGDFNDDGVDDIIIGSSSFPNVGNTIVIFGTNTVFSSLYTISDINAGNGIIISGEGSDNFGESVSFAGDVNDDGVDDVTINAPLYDGSGFRNNGRTYVIFGSSTITNIDVSALDGNNGFVINGFPQNDSGSQSKVSDAGDIDNDGIDDIILGFPGYDEGSNLSTGRVCVIYGNSIGFSASLNLLSLDGSNGFSILGEEANTALGFSVGAAEDFNNDGINDFIVGAPRKDVNTIRDIGEAYVIYGRGSFPSTFNSSDLNGANSMTIRGIQRPDYIRNSGFNNLGYAVDGLHDINDDGISDIIVSATGGGAGNQGGAYVIFGSSSNPDIINAGEVFGNVGYQVFEDERFSRQRFGQSVSSIGDFNADGINDFIVGAIRSATSFRNNGKAYVFYGETFDLDDSELPTISCPSNQELYANAVLPNYIHFLPSVSDNCTYNTDMTYSQNPPEGTPFISDTNVTITVTDRSGNMETCTFLVSLKTTTAEIDCNTTSFSVNDLNGTNGLILYGEKALSRTGTDVNSLGDVNGDGIDDFIVAARGEDLSFAGPYGTDFIDIIGGGYVVFGTASGFPPNINLKMLNGSNGFIIRDDTAYSSQPNTAFAASSAGDINNDGINDIMVSDPFRKTSLGSELGYNYIIFGRATGFPLEFNLSTLNGSNGFTVIGADPFERPGYALDTVGDINNDGIDDIALSEGSGSGSSLTGKCHILYGNSSGFPAIIRVNEIDGSNGFTIVGDVGTSGKIGYYVAGLGDINGDAIDDITIGGNKARKFVVFGRPRGSSFPATLNVDELDGINGFAVEHSLESLSLEVSKAGDINNDGFNDVTFGGRYVLFGRNAFPSIFDLVNLDGTNGFSFSSNVSNLNYAGDFNNDGYDDLIFGRSSSYYVIYGKET